MRRLFNLLLAAIVGAAMFSCQKAEEPIDAGQVPETRANGVGTLWRVVYVETNDVNPENALDYVLPNGEPFFNAVEFFAGNIGKRTVNGVVEPTLFLNDKMTNLLENGGYQKYVQPLQAKGIKVLLTILGDHKGIGVASMNATQTTQFAKILAHAVEKYGLDGIGFDDEYSDDESSYRAASYSEIITKLRALLPAGKLITVFDWGATGSLTAEAVACIDYGYHGFFGPNYYVTSRDFAIPDSGWSPISINLGQGNDGYLTQILQNASKAKAQGYGAMMYFNLRKRSEVNPTNVFTAAASGAGLGAPVTCTNGNRNQDWTFVPTGYTMTMDEVAK